MGSSQQMVVLVGQLLAVDYLLPAGGCHLWFAGQRFGLPSRFPRLRTQMVGHKQMQLFYTAASKLMNETATVSVCGVCMHVGGACDYYIQQQRLEEASGSSASHSSFHLGRFG